MIVDDRLRFLVDNEQEPGMLEMVFTCAKDIEFNDVKVQLHVGGDAKFSIALGDETNYPVLLCAGNTLRMMVPVELKVSLND